jgi:type III restriction enzyme
MELKKYQRDTLTLVESYLREIAKAKEGHEKIKAALAAEPTLLASLPEPDYAKTAWTKVAGTRTFYPRKNGLGENIADFYIKLPTGGGKTLLACHAIDIINRVYLRKQTGIVLWIMPSETIYRQTKQTLSDRAHPYRQALDIASAGRTVICEKSDRFSRQDIAENLVIMLLMLPSANRLNKEVLRVFKDNSGFAEFFPLEDDIEANKKLLDAFPNLHYFGQEDGFFGKVAKTSLGNTLRILRPIIIIDEGHKAYSGSAQRTITDFNPSIILELSATPPEQSNKLVDIPGQVLEAEGMIKLDLHVFNESTLSWQDVLRKAWKKRLELENKAKEYEANTGMYIRPMCLIQVERTGADQRKPGVIHAEEAREFLIKQCGAKPEEVAVKSSEKNDIEDIDLMLRDTEIRFIITKQALQEGWDAPFAYILTVLTNPCSELSLTQLVGRVLRQPYAQKTKVPDLDESYVFCNRPNAPALLEAIKRGFQADGMGDIAGRIAVDRDDTGLGTTSTTSIGYRSQFKRFEGKIYLPKFAIKEGDSWRDIDYDVDILSRINWSAANLEDLTGLKLAEKPMEDREIVVGLTSDRSEVIAARGTTATKANWRIDKVFMTRQLLDIVPNPWIAHEIAGEVISELTKNQGEALVTENFSFIIEELRKCLSSECDRLAEEVFRGLVKSRKLCFFLMTSKGGYVLPKTFTFKNTGKPLVKDNYDPIQKSLFEKVPEDSLNTLEKSVALCLDSQAKLLWWYRNMSRQNHYFVQGWRKGRIFPDFIFTEESKTQSGDYDKIYVLESKGEHLTGNLDTAYKSNIFDYCNELGAEREWRELNAEFGDKEFIFNVVYEKEWEKRIQEIMS